MEKKFFIVIICILSILSASAQNKIGLITLEVKDGNMVNKMAVGNFSYNFNQYKANSKYDSTTKTVTLMLSCKEIPTFIYEATSKGMSHIISLKLTCYGEDGTKQEILKFPAAVIEDLSESYAVQDEEMSDKSIVIRSNTLIIDNVKL